MRLCGVVASERQRARVTVHDAHRISCCAWQLPRNHNSTKLEMIMTRTLASLVLALTFVAGASVAHADSSLMVHGYQGTNYSGR